MLAWYEVSIAVHVAGLRHAMSIRDQRKDNHGYKGRDMQDNLFGVLGEMAVAKFKNYYFAGTVDTFKDADIGKYIQVRTVGSNRNRNLIVRKADPDNHVYVLVEISKQTGGYNGTIHGWIMGGDAKKSEWLTDFGQPNRPMAYKVPMSSLRNCTKPSKSNR